MQAKSATICGCCRLFKMLISVSRFSFSFLVSLLICTALTAAYDFFLYSTVSIILLRWHLMHVAVHGPHGLDGTHCRQRGRATRRTYLMLSEIDGSKTTLTDLSTSPELANNLIWLLLRIWSWPPGRGAGHPWSRHIAAAAERFYRLQSSSSPSLAFQASRLNARSGLCLMGMRERGTGADLFGTTVRLPRSSSPSCDCREEGSRGGPWYSRCEEGSFSCAGRWPGRGQAWMNDSADDTMTR